MDEKNLSSVLAGFDPGTQHNVELWLNGNYDEETKEAIRQLILTNPQEIIDSFYTILTFGTGGLRGIVGIGPNRMNSYTVRAATQGLANYLLKNAPADKKPCAFIGYDSRTNSRHFSEEAAKVLAGNGIEVFLFDELRPTPLVSFGVRNKKCMAGIMITASHNPPQYNGYKVYWSDGGQVLPPHDRGIVEEVKLITDSSKVMTTDITNPLIHFIDGQIDEAYIKAVNKLQNYPEENKKFGNTLKVVYSNLHGTGITLVPKILSDWGFSNLSFVEEQKEPDGLFPTVSYPNPEYPEALKLGIERMLATRSDIFVANDPDADRLGVVVNRKGVPFILTGNQIACICIEHICHALESQNRLPKNAAFIKTIVTTELFRKIAEAYHRPCIDVLTGFKYIAEKIHEWEQDPEKKYHFLFGAEESYGYLLGTESRDKDAVLACALLCEIALHAKRQNKDLVDLLYDLYASYGVYRERLVSVDFEDSKAGKELMDFAMKKLREDPPESVAGVKVQIIEDYLISTRFHIESGKKEPLTLPKSNVLLFWLSDCTKIVVRPSGTEPKIKLYCDVVEKSGSETIENTIVKCDAYSDKLLTAMKTRLLGS